MARVRIDDLPVLKQLSERSQRGVFGGVSETKGGVSETKLAYDGGIKPITMRTTMVGSKCIFPGTSTARNAGNAAQPMNGARPGDISLRPCRWRCGRGRCS